MGNKRAVHSFVDLFIQRIFTENLIGQRSESHCEQKTNSRCHGDNRQGYKRQVRVTRTKGQAVDGWGKEMGCYCGSGFRRVFEADPKEVRVQILHPLGESTLAPEDVRGSQGLEGEKAR